MLCGADIGAAYGTAKSGVGVASLGVMNPAAVMKSMIPVVMAGVIGIYGLIVAVIIVGMSASHARAHTRAHAHTPRQPLLASP